jgi:5-methyltetrahydrofolate--homocysteine methyltransferase
VHTAVKIAPGYENPVVYVKDASKSVPVVSSLLSDVREAFITSHNLEYEELRETYAGKSAQVKYVSLNEARANKAKIDWREQPPIKPKFVGTKEFRDYPVAEIKEYISWMFFFIVWELKGKFPEILDDPNMGSEAKKLFEDAQAILEDIVSKHLLTANGVVSILPANATGDDIEVYTDESRTNVLTRFCNLRNQTKKDDGVPNLCLSDFVAPKETGIPDYIGAFAVTAGIGTEALVKEFEAKLDDYSAIIVKALADRLAEAFTELLHYIVRRELWGYAPNENLTLNDMLMEKYKGIRPAHGYPACPDHSEKEILFNLLGAQNLGIELTDSFSMMPAASVSGLIFAHPQSRYFFVDRIGRDQVEDYARRKGVSPEQVEKWLASNLNYK